MNRRAFLGTLAFVAAPRAAKAEQVGRALWHRQEGQT